VSACPRCGTPDPSPQHLGREGGKVIWTLYYCSVCAFGWRDSEPRTTIDPAARDAFFRVNPKELDHYPVMLPPGVI